MLTSNILNGFFVTIFFGTLCTISYNFFGWDVSLERIFSLMLFLSILVLLLNRNRSAKYITSDLRIVSLVLVVEIWLLICTLFCSEEIRFLYYRTMFNCFLGFFCYTIFRDISFEQKYKKVGVILFAVLLFLSIYGAFDFNLLSYSNKQELAEGGFNPNAILNSLVLYLIIYNLIYIERKTSMAMSALVVIASGLQFSRQNIVASIFLLWSPIRKSKMLMFVVLFVSSGIVAFVDVEIFVYLEKAFLQYTGYIPSTRLEWLSMSVDLIGDSLLLPNFIQPVDNTGVTILLQFGLVGGLGLLAVSLIAWIRLAIISAPLAMSFLVLFILNDIHFEAAYWFIVFCMLSDQTFKKVTEYQNEKRNSLLANPIGGC